jgi:hypothetical protein
VPQFDPVEAQLCQRAAPEQGEEPLRVLVVGCRVHVIGNLGVAQQAEDSLPALLLCLQRQHRLQRSVLIADKENVRRSPAEVIPPQTVPDGRQEYAIVIAALQERFPLSSKSS